MVTPRTAMHKAEKSLESCRVLRGCEKHVEEWRKTFRSHTAVRVRSHAQEAEKAQYSEPRLLTGMARMGMVKELVHRMTR